VQQREAAERVLDLRTYEALCQHLLHDVLGIARAIELWHDRDPGGTERHRAHEQRILDRARIRAEVDDKLGPQAQARLHALLR
jgi:hypothetical protein